MENKFRLKSQKQRMKYKIEKKRLQIYWSEETGRVYRNGKSLVSAEEARQRMAQGEYCGVDMCWQGVIPVNIFIAVQSEARDLNERIERGCRNQGIERCTETNGCPMTCEQ